MPSDAPDNLVEVSDHPQYYIAPSEIPVNEVKTKPKQEVPVVKSTIKNEEEIEFISGDKKMIVGAPL